MAEKEQPLSSILEFFMLVGRLKHLKRTGWVLRKIEDCESIAGHMYRMAVMAFLLDDTTPCNLNRDRCIKMALIHDISECIVGDLTPFCGVSKEEKHKREMEAMNKLCSLVNENIGKEFLHLYTEYTEQITNEAKSVKDLDKLDMLLQAYQYELEAKESLDLQDFFDNTKGIQNSTVLNWFQELQLHRNKNSPSTSGKSRVFEFLLLLGKLKHLKRTCWDESKVSSECESVADHMYRLSIMAFLVDGDSSLGLNRDKCIKLALIKDIAESVRLKFTEFKIEGNEKDQTNLKAMEKVCNLVNEKVNKEMLDLYKEYQAQQTTEAKVVKDLDKFENLLQAYEYKKDAGITPDVPPIPSELCGLHNSGVSKWAKELQVLQNKNLQLCSQ